MIQRVTIDLSYFYAVLHADLCSSHADSYLLYAEFNILQVDSRSKHADSYLL